MAMLRSALGRVSRRLLGPSEIIRTRPLPSLRPAETLMSPPQPATRLMRTFTSPTGAAAGTRRVPNFQGWRHFPVISKVNEGMKFSQQMRFLSVESKE
nr:unnamed protein product [Digitaria exilis]